MSATPSLEKVRGDVLHRFLLLFAASLLAGAVVMTPFLVQHRRTGDIAIAVGVAAVYFALDRVPITHRTRAVLLIAQLTLSNSARAFIQGFDATVMLVGIAAPFLGMLFLGGWAGLASFALHVATCVVVGLLATRGLLLPSTDPTAMRMAPEFWPYVVMAEVFAGGPMIYVAHLVVSRLDSALSEARQSVEALRQAQDQLAANERLKTLGLLAGCVAHDLNNTLTVIAGEVELAESLGAEERESILQATSSASQLARQVLLSAGSDVAQVRPIDLQQSLRPSLQALSRLLPETVVVHASLAPQPLTAVADPVLLQQALLNLAVNARDAMPQGGVLTVSLQPEARHGQAGVRLAVSDTGCGMSAETLARASEPFFTTKERGLGTGLGLSNVRSTAERLGGTLELSSELGQGTKAVMWLPTSDLKVRREDADKDVSAGDGRIVLLVEDNLRVRAIAFEILERAGYQVIEAQHVGRAREALLGGGAFDALVVDLVLPDGSGLDLAREFRSRHPGAGIVITSGYAPRTEDREALAGAEFRYLAKPFGAAALARALAAAIATRSPPPAETASLPSFDSTADRAGEADT